MDTMTLPAGSKLSTFEVENQIPLTTLQLSKDYFDRDQGIHEFTIALCRQHDHGRRNRQAPDPSPETVNFLFLLQVRRTFGFGLVAERLVGQMESATIKRFWDSRLSSRFRDYDRRNNGVGYFRWSDNEPSARHKHDHKRAILLEDGKGHEVVVPKSGHQPFPELDFDKVAEEDREANDWTIDDDMMGKVYEGVIKILHHDKPRCCKTEKLKQVHVPIFAVSGGSSSPHLAPSSSQDLDMSQRFGQSKGSANLLYLPIAPPDNIPLGRRSDPVGALSSNPLLPVPTRDPTIGPRRILSNDNEGSPPAPPASAHNPRTGKLPGHPDEDEARKEPNVEKRLERRKSGSR